MNILALDIATKTGWACRKRDTLHSGRGDFPLKRGDSPGMRYHYFRTWLRSCLRIWEIDLVVYEMPHLRGAAATQVLCGMVSVMQEECAVGNIDHTMVQSKQLKKWTTGNGKASKEDMIAAMQKRYPEQNIPSDVKEGNDQADALALLGYIEEKLGVNGLDQQKGDAKC